MPKKNFWEEKTLEEMTTEEWESLCDRCGKCCLNKIHYEGNKHVHYTNVVCKLFDSKKCSCLNYASRKKFIKDCIKLTPEKVREKDYLPSTCAYRLVLKKKPLEPWHHLISGSYDTVLKQKDSVLGKVINEIHVDDRNLDEHVIKWIKPDSLTGD